VYVCACVCVCVCVGVCDMQISVTVIAWGIAKSLIEDNYKYIARFIT